MKFALILLLAYLLGAIPTAVWLSRALFGKDVRTQGSGNAGSTNMYRAFGLWPGLSVQLFDIAKGFVAVWLPLWLAPEATAASLVNLQYGCGLAAVVGHVYPVWAGFKGGKGINTLLGMMLGLSWPIALVAIGVFALVLFFSSMVSLGSMLAVASLPVQLWLRSILYAEGFSTVQLALAIAVPLFVVFTHRTNLQRLLAGNERRVNFGLNKPKAPKTEGA